MSLVEKREKQDARNPPLQPGEFRVIHFLIQPIFYFGLAFMQ